MAAQKNIGTILFVDDDIYCHRVADLIISNLTEYKILHAYKGSEAISLAEKYSDRIKVIFLDILMPDMQGDEMYQELAKRSSLKKTSIVLQSGLAASNPKIVKLLELPNIRFLSKPYDKTQLLEIINESTAATGNSSP